MNIRRLVNDYVECDSFEMIYKDNKLKIYYYDAIDHFSDAKIKIIKANNKYIVEGNNLAIETMFKEFIIISGKIKKIVLDDNE